MVKLKGNIMGNFTKLVLVVLPVILVFWAIMPISATGKKNPDGDLFEAIRWIESRDGKDPDSKHKGTCGELGPYQITDIYLKDVNLELEHRDRSPFPSDARLYRAESERMMRVYFQMYGDGLSKVELGMLHHAGPDWRSKPWSKSYGNKIKAYWRSN